VPSAPGWRVRRPDQSENCCFGCIPIRLMSIQGECSWAGLMTPDVLSCCSRRAGAVAGTTMVTGALAQPKTAEAPDASHGHDSGEGHGAKLSAAQPGRSDHGDRATPGERVHLSVCTGVFQRHPHPHHGRHVRRPDLWRQQGLRRLEADRPSRSPIVFYRCGHAKQAGVHTRATHRSPGQAKSTSRA
jgi:hypothetical protein